MVAGRADQWTGVVAMGGRRFRGAAVAGGLVVLAAWVGLAPTSALGQTFSYTGGEQSYVVPAGVTEVHVVVVGAPGGHTSGSPGLGGLGAVVSADLPVPQGQTALYVEVGGIGVGPGFTGSRGGFNGGGPDGGGGASDVRLLPRSQAGSINSRAVVAGGGGSEGFGEAGANAGASARGSISGKAGTAIAGGAGGIGGSSGSPGDDGEPGSLGQGGSGAPDRFGPDLGAGGGGGYYGGGGGGDACPGNFCLPLGGGGGGSSYVTKQDKNVSFGLDQARTPYITITAPIVTLSGLSVSPSSFKLTGRRVAHRCVPVSRRNRKRRPCRRPIGLDVSYTLSQAATVTFTLTGSSPGRIVHGKCRASSRANRHHHRCTSVIPLQGSLSQQNAPGANTLVLSGWGGRPLVSGSYQLTATATGSAGAGAPQTASFRLN
jgi:hypothetical protein